MRAAPTTHLVLLGDGTHAEGDTDITHLNFGIVRHKRPSVGEIGEHMPKVLVLSSQRQGEKEKIRK
jgi:hypothetical protein